MVLVEPGKEVRTFAPDGQAEPPGLGHGLESLFQVRLQFLHHQHPGKGRQKIPQQGLGQGVGESQLEQPDFIGQAQFPQGVHDIGAGHAAGDDAPGAAATDLVEGRSLGQGPGLVFRGQEPHVGLAGHRRHHHLAEGVLMKPAGPRPGRQSPPGSRGPGYGSPGWWCAAAPGP